jgi:hypothetical protein
VINVSNYNFGSINLNLKYVRNWKIWILSEADLNDRVPRRDEVTGDWRKLHNEELRNLYQSPNIIRMIKSRRMRWAGHVARMGTTRNAYRILVGKPEGKRPLGRPRRSWLDNIKMDL